MAFLQCSPQSPFLPPFSRAAAAWRVVDSERLAPLPLDADLSLCVDGAFSPATMAPSRLFGRCCSSSGNSSLLENLTFKAGSKGAGAIFAVVRASAFCLAHCRFLICSGVLNLFLQLPAPVTWEPPHNRHLGLQYSA